jgi:hypothetical protein
LPAEEPLGVLEPVAYFNGAMPTGVTVLQQGRIFVNFPIQSGLMMYNLRLLRSRMARRLLILMSLLNRTDQHDPAKALLSVQSVVVDPLDSLWILDTGSPLFQPTEYGGPKIVCVDLTNDQIIKKILFPQDVALPTIKYDIASEDVTKNSTIIWSKSNAQSIMNVLYNKSNDFLNNSSNTVLKTLVNSSTGFAGHMKLVDLQPNTTYYYKVWFRSQ